MGRCYVDASQVRPEAGRVETVFVHRVRDQLQAVRFEDFARTLIGRVFDRNRIAWLEENAGGETQRLLRAADDEDFVGGARNASVPKKIRRDRFSEP